MGVSQPDGMTSATSMPVLRPHILTSWVSDGERLGLRLASDPRILGLNLSSLRRTIAPTGER